MAEEASSATLPLMRRKYEESLKVQLQKDLQFENINAVPRVEKVVINMGLGEATQNAKILDSAVSELGTITGQKPVVTRAKKAIANFKLREGMPIGAMVTLRGNRMYEFLDRLVGAALPRVRDFKGISGKGFDGRGNYSLGLNDQTIFPEIDIDKVDKVKGMTITVVTTASTDSEGLALLRALGMPFQKNSEA
jgi:large subunit ribosomal protein L5